MPERRVNRPHLIILCAAFVAVDTVGIIVPGLLGSIICVAGFAYFFCGIALLGKNAKPSRPSS